MAGGKEFFMDPGELGILSTEEIIDAGENFLNSDPNDIKYVPPTKVKDKEEKVEEEEETEEGDDKAKGKASKAKDVKTKVVPSREIKDDDVFGAMEKKVNEEEEEETEEDDERPLDKKKGGQKLPAKKEGEKQEGEQEEGEQEEEENTYTVIARELVTHGVFSEDQDEEGNTIPIQIDSPEEFLERFQIEGRKYAADVIEKYLERYGDDYKDMFENVFVKGVAPIDYLNRYAKIESIKGLDITNEDNQERIVRELYRSEGRSAEYIEKKMQQHKNYNDLADEAAEAQKVLLQKEEAEIARSAAEKQAEIARKAHIRAEYVNNVNRILTDKMKAKEFDGIPVDRKFAEKTYSYITQVKYQTNDKQDLTEFDKDILELGRPENHELKVKLAMLLQLAKEDPKLTKLSKRAVSKESSKLFEGLRKQSQRNTRKQEEEQEEQPTSKSWFNNNG